MLNQFSRTELLIGKDGIQKLQKAKVAIFGIGGVGSFVVEGLVRAGISNFILVDDDKVCLTNLNRQLIATRKTIGKPKVEIAKTRILEINPNANVEIYQEFFMKDTKGILDDTIDYIIDCVDTVTAKIELVVKANKLNIPIISCMGTGNKLDPTRFEVTDIYKTSVCPLAKVMRKELRTRGIKELKVVYSREEPIKPDETENCSCKTECICPPGTKRKCTVRNQVPGSISFVPSVAGLIAAGEVIKDIIKRIYVNRKGEIFLERYEEIERTIITKYRKKIWRKFIKGIQEYDMIKEGDKIAVCMSGGKDSMLMAKCFQELLKHGKMNFELVFLCMNPGYNEINKQKIIVNSKILNIPITMFETDIFNRVATIDDHPCYLCARMRRGYLYEKAKELGCNKIALGHHFDDVIETILMGMFYGAQMQTMMPKVKSTSHPGMELIRPLYLVKEDDIINWRERNDLQFIQCACRFTEHCTMYDNSDGGSKREEMKKLIKELRQVYSNIDMNIFRSVQNVNLDTIISYRKDGQTHHFLDNYNK